MASLHRMLSSDGRWSLVRQALSATYLPRFAPAACIDAGAWRRPCRAHGGRCDGRGPRVRGRIRDSLQVLDLLAQRIASGTARWPAQGGAPRLRHGGGVESASIWHRRQRSAGEPLEHCGDRVCHYRRLGGLLFPLHPGLDAHTGTRCLAVASIRTQAWHVRPCLGTVGKLI